jgi:hypothetical protein
MHARPPTHTCTYIHTSYIHLQLLKNQNRHTHLIGQSQERSLKWNSKNGTWNSVGSRHMRGHRGNELADQLVKQAARNKNTDECYNRFPKSAVMCELKEQSVKQWQNEWERTTKGSITKYFLPKTVDRMKLTINTTPNFTAIVTSHGNIKSYSHKFKIIQSPMCSC